MSQALRRPERSRPDAATELAEHRLGVLQLARELGNVSEACRRRGLDRTSFYEWQRRFRTHGFEGLKDLPPVHRSHPQTTPPETVARIRELALRHPGNGCNRIEALLALEGRRVSAVTVQKILKDGGLGTRHDRWLRLEERSAGGTVELSGEQVAFLERFNPCFRERHAESSAPGERLAADTLPVGHLTGIGKVFLHAVVDTYNSYAFGSLHVLRSPRFAVAVLHNHVLPFYHKLNRPVRAILTDNGREFCGIGPHPYQLYLKFNGIEHRRTTPQAGRCNGFVERFCNTVRDEFIVDRRGGAHDGTIEELQARFDQWLVHYNTKRPHPGYRNRGRRPIDTFANFGGHNA